MSAPVPLVLADSISGDPLRNSNILYHARAAGPLVGATILNNWLVDPLFLKMIMAGSGFISQLCKKAAESPKRGLLARDYQCLVKNF
jgi:hypothetical protein